MKFFFILIVFAVAGYYGWQLMNKKVDLDKATQGQQKEMDAEIQQGLSRANVPQSGQSESRPVALPAGRTAERIQDIQGAANSREGAEPKQ